MNKYGIYATLVSTLCLSLYQTAWSDTTPTSMSGPIEPLTPSPAPTLTPGASTTPASPPSPDTQALNCQYHIPANTTNIDNQLVSDWGTQAIIQSFDFSPDSLPTELASLQNCFTDQGWKGFNDALNKSGNIAAIKTQRLTVSSQADGKSMISLIKDNQWKLTLPLQVVYQNDKQKFTQVLAVDVLIGRKMNGDLGIMQMIATPKPAAKSPTTPTPAAQ